MTHALSIGVFVGLQTKPTTVCGITVRKDTETTMESNEVTCPECARLLSFSDEADK